MSVIVYCFRNDLRLRDNTALALACEGAQQLLPVYCHDPAQQANLPWGFPRRSAHRGEFLAATLSALDEKLRQRGSRLLEFDGASAGLLPRVVAATGAGGIACETITAPEEVAEITALRVAGILVEEHWQ